MPISIKSAEEITKMRRAGQLAAQVLDMIEPFVQAGVTTGQLDKLCHDFIVEELQAIPAPLNYNGFPKSICTSVNHVACHGIPNDEKLNDGDIINIDVTLIKDGFHGDTSKMFIIGTPSPQAEKLVRVTQECLYKAIFLIKPGRQLGDLGYAIQQHAEKNGFSVVRDYCGHGIGKEFHEEPQILHFGLPNTGLALKAGMTFTLEPIINVGTFHTLLLRDMWTVVTKDKSLSAQFEHTVLVTDNGVEILTLREEEHFLLN